MDVNVLESLVSLNNLHDPIIYDTIILEEYFNRVLFNIRWRKESERK